MALFDWPVSVSGTEYQGEFLFDEVDFGYGYTQAVGRGLNNETRKWEITVELIHQLDVLEIQSFLRAHQNGTPFEWREPDSERLVKVRCKSYRIRPRSSVYRDVTATFTIVNELP